MKTGTFVRDQEPGLGVTQQHGWTEVAPTSPDDIRNLTLSSLRSVNMARGSGLLSPLADAVFM